MSKPKSSSRGFLVHPFPDPLDISPDANLESEFRRFKKQWDLYATSAGINQLEASRAKSTLLTAIGPECSRLYNQSFQLTPEDQQTASTVLAAIERNLIEPSIGKLQRRIDFNVQSRYANELYSRYFRRLRQKLQGCHYGDLEDDVLLDKIISSITNEDLSVELCYMDNLTLDLAIERCLKEDLKKSQSIEKGKKNHKVNVSCDNTKSTVGNNDKRVNQPKNKGAYKRTENPSKAYVKVPPGAVTCLQCGNFRKGMDHMANPTLCPAHGVMCKKCKEFNHLTSQCEPRRGVAGKT